MRGRPFVPGGHIPLPPVEEEGRAGTIRAVHLVRELPTGPDASHIGQLVARVTLDTLVVGRVEHASPRGGDGYVLLSDGVHRGTNVGSWFVAAWAKS